MSSDVLFTGARARHPAKIRRCWYRSATAAPCSSACSEPTRDNRLRHRAERPVQRWEVHVGDSAAAARLNVIADDVILTEDDWRGWQEAVHGLDVHWVRVQIALDVLEVRERARSDRMPGHARSQYQQAYRYPTYDSQVDTGVLDPDAAAAAVCTDWRTTRSKPQ